MTPLVLQSLAWLPTRTALRLLYGMRVYGTDNLALIPRGNGVIFVANHISKLDPVIVTAGLIPLSRFAPLHYGSREKDGYSHFPVGKYLYGGTLFKLWGAYPIYRGRETYEESLKHHLEFLAKGKSVCFFPEGGIDENGARKPARPGITHLAKLSSATLVPVKIVLTTEKKIELYFGHPFAIEELEAQTAHLELDSKERSIAIAEKVMDRVYSLG